MSDAETLLWLADLALFNLADSISSEEEDSIGDVIGERGLLEEEI
jgi:hypothetical protein